MPKDQHNYEVILQCVLRKLSYAKKTGALGRALSTIMCVLHFNYISNTPPRKKSNQILTYDDNKPHKFSRFIVSVEI